ncbi:MAG: DUF1700 domain-containing protein [Clostridia bacterium]
MNKEQYIKKIKECLKRLPQEEILKACEYYEEYFAEAGEENEQAAIKELGEPRKNANKIISEFALKDVEENTDGKKRMSIFWIVILAIFASPIALPIAIVFFVLILVLIIVIFSCVISIGAVGLSLFLAGPFSIILGALAFTQGSAVTIFYIGCGLMGIAIGTIIIWGSIVLCKKSYRFVVSLVAKFLKRGAKSE